MPHAHEIAAIAERYARRASFDERYSWLRPDICASVQERQRGMLKLFIRHGVRDLANLHITEVGCGGGANLLELLRMGCRPEYLIGIELLEDRFLQARHVLPTALHIYHGDAAGASIVPESQDIVLLSTVFSSILDDDTQTNLAQALWHWVRPGGAVLWYDFVYDNPTNPDVRGVSRSRVQALFPSATLHAHRVTLAPPLARRLVRIHPALYGAFNTVPWLRTHLLCWISKP